MPFEKNINPMLHPEVTCINMRAIMLTPPILVHAGSIYTQSPHFDFPTRYVHSDKECVQKIFMGFYTTFLPIPTVLALQMNLHRKVIVISVLAFGILSVTVATLRIPILISVSSMKTDASIDVGKTIIVASFEVQCAIAVANLPAMKALWDQGQR
jgi:hypothetical protein